MTIQAEFKSKRNCSDFLGQCRFDHPTTEKQFIETHISCVILTGQFAYKIKKPVNLGFVDYTSLEKRKKYCELELELNRRFASNLYLEIVPLIEYNNWIFFGTTQDSNAMLEGDVVDYAVKMRQFPQQAIAANCLQDDLITAELVDEFGRNWAGLHSQFESAIPTADYAQPAKVIQAATDNFGPLLESFRGDERFDELSRLATWTQTQVEELRDAMLQRLGDGKVKRCHGDLHLKNLILQDSKLSAFDGIEFNEEFQFVDVLSEISFPVMDLFARGRSDLAWRMLNSYLEEAADYSDFALLRFYLVYRAMIRAKVSWLNPNNRTDERRKQFASAGKPDDPFAGPWDKYIHTACFFAFQMQPGLTITHGFSGSGKSTAAMKLIEENGGIRVRSDVLRSQFSNKCHADEKYSSVLSDWVYAYLADVCRDGLRSGFPMVADATFLDSRRRKPFFNLANTVNVKFEILDCQAPFEVLADRIRNRSGDPSEADIDVLKDQMENHTPLSRQESRHIIQ